MTTRTRSARLAAIAAPTEPRTVRVDMLRHLERHAAAMAAAVAAADAMTDHERRTRRRQLGAMFAELRPTVGLMARPTDLLMPGTSNTKLAKNPAPTVSYTGSPSTSGRVHVDTADGPVRLVFSQCPHAGRCAAVCVLTGGRGKFSSTMAGRRWRDLVAYTDPVGWAQLIRLEIIAAADRHGMILARLDTGTELGLGRMVPAILADTPNGATVRGYDYAKNPAVLEGNGWTDNRHHRTVYSWNESTEPAAVGRFLRRGGSVAVVLNIPKGAPIPATWRIGRTDWPTVDGDATDNRLADPGAVVVVLRAKGAATTARMADRLAGFVLPTV